MTTDVVTRETEHVDEHPHPGVRVYLIVGLILFIVTAIEVALYYLEPTVGRAIAYPLLLVLSASKFALVAMFYMHLRFDNRLFSGLFVFGLAVAASLLLALLLLFLFAPVHQGGMA